MNDSSDPAVAICLKSTTVLSAAFLFMMIWVLSTASVTLGIPTNAAVPMVESTAVHFRFAAARSLRIAMPKSTWEKFSPTSSAVPASPEYPTKALTSAMPSMRASTATWVWAVSFKVTVLSDFSIPKPPSMDTKSKMFIIACPATCSSSPLAPFRLSLRVDDGPVVTVRSVLPVL